MIGHEHEATELRDDSRVGIRSIRREDLELERRFVESLSSRTGYLRLLSGRHPTPAEFEHWTDVDPSREFAFVALAAEGDGERMVGVGRCAVDTEDSS